MKLTKQQLKKIIKEELGAIQEASPRDGARELAKMALKMSLDATQAVFALEAAVRMIEEEGIAPSDVQEQEIS